MKKLLVFCLMLGVSNVFAQSVATVLFTSKKVIAIRDGVVRTLSRGSALSVGDAIITSQGALAHIKYENGTLINIGDASNYKILAYSPNGSDDKIKAELNVGKIKFKTTGKMNESLKTPVMALAILGTSGEVLVTNRVAHGAAKKFSASKGGIIAYVNLTSGAARVVGGGAIPLGTPVSITNDQGVPVIVPVAAFPKEGVMPTVESAPGTIASSSEADTQISGSAETGQSTTTSDSEAPVVTNVTQIQTQTIGETTVASVPASSGAAIYTALPDIALTCL